MGLLLSVLVACVGVVELLTFFHNVNKRVSYTPYQSNLENVSDGYIRELKDARRRIYDDLQRLQNANETETEAKLEVPKGIPMFKVNHHEDIELEYNENLTKSRSPSPRKFLVTEKEEEPQRPPSPRKFVVSECPPIKKSKSQPSLPEFLIQEEGTLDNSPSKTKYLLQEQPGTSLPRQFIVTEHELNTVVFDHSNFDSDIEVTTRNEEDYRRSPSPYPLCDLSQVPRNSICSELVDSLAVVNEEQPDSGSSSPKNKNDVLISQHNSSEFQTGDKTVDINHVSVTRSTDSKVSYERAKVLVTDGYEAPICVNVDNSANLTVLDHISHLSKVELELEEALADSSTYDAKYLDNLDGINRSKIQRSSNSRKSFRRKSTNQSSIESTASTSRPQSFTDDRSTSELLKDAANELQKVSLYDGVTLPNGNSSQNNSVPSKEPEPFWVKSVQ